MKWAEDAPPKEIPTKHDVSFYYPRGYRRPGGGGMEEEYLQIRKQELYCLIIEQQPKKKKKKAPIRQLPSSDHPKASHS